MPDRPCKAEERQVARLLGGQRYPANSGGRVDVEGPVFLAQVKHLRTCSLASLEALALELAALGTHRGRLGIVIVKRRGGRGHHTSRLVVLIQEVFQKLAGLNRSEVVIGADERG